MTIEVINIHEAKTQLSRLVELAAAGREFVIAKAGKPMVRVLPFVEGSKHPMGGMRGQSDITLDLKKAFNDEVDVMFGN
jgi:antitoxin (DNA-binding transcriptional repressor) of toxin-antitoxin stability system